MVVVDYSMPSMNGLDFCARLSDPLIRKAMFTGVADEKVAVGAFNAGLIHRFIPKQATGAISVALGFIDDLQREYFSQYSARLKNTLSINPPGFLTEPAIARFVEALMEKEQLVEYYLVDEPPGLLLLKGNGRMYRFVALNQQQMDEQLSYAMRQGVPEDLASRMRANEVIGFFGGDAPEDYFGDEPYPWHENCRPAEAIQGRNERWFVAVLEDAAQDVDFDPATACYDAYLRSL